MDAKNIDLVMEVLAEEIRRLKTDLYLKDLEIERLKERLDEFYQPCKAVAENG